MKAPTTWTMADAKRDFERGLLRGASIGYENVMGDQLYTVVLHSKLDLDGSGVLVDARTGNTRKFVKMGSAHSAIQQVGFRFTEFWGK